MSASYGIRLLCLCLTCFFLVDLALSALVRLLMPAALRWAAKMRAGHAARFLFWLRIAPSAGAVVAVLGLCVPSYVWLESNAGTERLTLLCLAATSLGAALCVIAVMRAAVVLWRSAHYMRSAKSRKVQIDASASELVEDVLVMESALPVLALAGVLRPKLLISRTVFEGLSPEQLEVALRHERAHCESGDNLKRLLLLLSPIALPSSKAFGVLERHFARYTEWAADDAASGGDPQRSVVLADALLRVSRLKAKSRLPSGSMQPSLLVSSLVADDCALSARIERLLNLPTETETVEDRIHSGYAVAIAIPALAALLWNLPSALSFVHAALERLLG